MSPRFTVLFALLSTVAFAPLSTVAGQGAKDSALVKANGADLDSIARDKSAPAYSKRAQARIRVRDSLFLVRAVPTPPPAPTPTPVDSTPPKDTTVVVTPPPVDTSAPPVVITPGPPPGPILFTHPFGPPANGAVLATLPQDTVSAAYPAITRRYRCTNVQVCLDTAQTGDEILLAKGATFRDVTVKPTARASWVTVRTDVTDVELGGPWQRMTPSRADALNLATIYSSGGSVPAITVTSGAHHVRFVGIRVKPAAFMTNALVRVGLGETNAALFPHHVVLDRVVVDGDTNDVRRCIAFDGDYLALLSSTLANCHSSPNNGGGDSQGVLKIHGRGPMRIENNAIAAGHQSVFIGGGDPSVRDILPADIVIRRNDLSRPLSWKGKWQVKTDLEFKIGKRILVEGNVLCHTWKDAQAGYAILAKTENQGGGTWGDWSETSDLTIRYNVICGASGGINLAALPQGPGVPMSRVTIYGNVADSIGVGPYQGDTGDCILQQGVADVVVVNNWCRNPIGRSAVYFNAVAPRFVLQTSVMGGQYALRYENGTAATLTPSGIYGGNAIVPWGTAFANWPAVPADSTRSALLTGVQVAP